jgi:alpha-1,2-mannosyltransferase
MVAWLQIKLVLVGGCRNAEDAERVQHLRDLAKHLALEDSVQFVVDAPYARLLHLYQTSTLALHAMWNEHFGISELSFLFPFLVKIAL